MSANREWFEFSGRVFDGGESTVYPELVGDVYLWDVKYGDDDGATLYMPAGHDSYSRDLRELFAKHGYPLDWDHPQDTDLLKKVMETIKSNYLVRENEYEELEFKLKDDKTWLKFTGRVFGGDTNAGDISNAKIGDVFVWDQSTEGVLNYEKGAAVLTDVKSAHQNHEFVYSADLRALFTANGFAPHMDFPDSPQLAEEIGLILQEEYEFTLEGDIRRIDPETGNVPFEDLPEIVDIEELGIF